MGEREREREGKRETERERAREKYREKERVSNKGRGIAATVVVCVVGVWTLQVVHYFR